MIRYFAAHPTAANLLLLVLLAAGLIAVPTLRRETFPEIPVDEIEVTVTYPGASAEDVEDAICQRIEDVVEGINFVKEVRCEALEGRGRAVVEIQDGADFDRFLNDIKTEIDAIDNFPGESDVPVVKQLGLRNFVASVAVTGPMSAADLKSYAEQLKDRILLGGVISQVTVQGFSGRQIRIEVPARALRQFGISVSGIAETVRRQSIDLPAGSIETRNQDALIRFADERRTPREFENLIIISGKTGAQIRLGDIAVITDRFEKDEDKILFNGRRAAQLEITKTRSEDTLVVIDWLNRFIERERRLAPPGVVLEITKNASSIVRDRLTMLLNNGAQGLFLVFLCLWLFFGFRYSFWVAMGLPASFLGTIFVMTAIGYSINMITMVGLLIAIGLLMDDAIVISENIATQLSKGAPPLEAAVEGTRQVMPGVLASFLTTACVFGPLAFLSGDIGNILKAMPVVLIVTLTVSLIEAFLILPHHLNHALHQESGRPLPGYRRRVDGGLDWLRRRALGPFVDMAVEWRYLTLGVVAMTFLISVAMVGGGILKFEVFPKLDGDTILARVLMPQGTPLWRTEAIIQRIESGLLRVDAALTPEQPGGRKLVRGITIELSKNTAAFETGAHVATLTADLLGADVRTATVDTILNRWRAEVGSLADVLSLKFSDFQIGFAGSPIDIRLSGGDLGRIKAASLELQQWLSAYKGVLDLSDDLRPGKPEVRLRLREGATTLGLDARTIADQLRSAFFGKTAADVQVGSEAYDINIRLPWADRDSLADLDYFTITTATGKQVPVGAVAIFEPGRGYARINRVDGRRTVTIQGDIDTNVTNANEIIADTKRRFLPGLLERYPGLGVAIKGQADAGADTGSSMARAFLFGMLGMFMLLSFQFRSYSEPIVVMVIIPMAFIGVVWGHLAMGLNLSMPSIMGFVALSGVVVNDSILLVTFIKRKQAQGFTIHDAACAASRERFRAILLTSLTTILGLLPLLMERSIQAQVLIPLVTSLAFGLLVATLLVLVLVPSFYTILDDFGLASAVEAEEEGPAAAQQRTGNAAVLADPD